MVLTRSAMRLERHWVAGEGNERPTRGGGGTNSGQAGVSTAGRVCETWSVRSRNNMRWTFSALAWEDLGRRPAMVTLTYPGDWENWAGSGTAVRNHVKAFKERWRRRWGEAITGVWIREFQQRGAPHLHMYVGLPEGVREDDYQLLCKRTMKRKRLEQAMPKYQARRQAGLLRGEMGSWLLAAWSGVVGTVGTSHERFGADVAPMFWGATVRDAEQGRVNWGRIAEYLWRESGKWGQKTAPESFANVGRSWGLWGVKPKFVVHGEVDRGVFVVVRRPLVTVVSKRSGGRAGRPRGMDGMTLFDIDNEQALRLLRWAEVEAQEKSERRDEARRASEASERA